MTNVEFKSTDDRYIVSITGHAEFAPAGTPDIVCSACSCLTYTLLQALLKAQYNQKIAWLDHMIDHKTGEFHAEIVPTAEAAAEVFAILDVISDGFALLQQQYPENVACKWGEN